MKNFDEIIDKLIDEHNFLKQMQSRIVENYDIMSENQSQNAENHQTVINNQSTIIQNQEIIVNNQINIVRNQSQIVQNQNSQLEVILDIQTLVLHKLNNMNGQSQSMDITEKMIAELIDAKKKTLLPKELNQYEKL
jgi:hypothetical protein